MWPPPFAATAAAPAPATAAAPAVWPLPFAATAAAPAPAPAPAPTVGPSFVAAAATVTVAESAASFEAAGLAPVGPASTATAAATRDGGAEVEEIVLRDLKMSPCLEIYGCKNAGECRLKDDFQKTRDRILASHGLMLASPVFFYTVSAHTKILMDRFQSLWVKKYWVDPMHRGPQKAQRKGLFIAVGATKGKKLFDGIHLVATYFFDAIDANFSGSMTYPGIETSADFQNKPDLSTEISRTAHALMSSLLERKRILFLGKHDAIRTQMADALTQYHAGSRFHVVTAGKESAQATHPGVVEAMAEIGIDMVFHQPPSRSKTIQECRPDIIVTMSDDIDIPVIPDVMTSVWNLPDPQHAPFDLIVQLREQIRENVTSMATDT